MSNWVLEVDISYFFILSQVSCIETDDCNCQYWPSILNLKGKGEKIKRKKKKEENNHPTYTQPHGWQYLGPGLLGSCFAFMGRDFYAKEVVENCWMRRYLATKRNNRFFGYVLFGKISTWHVKFIFVEKKKVKFFWNLIFNRIKRFCFPLHVLTLCSHSSRI